MQYNIIYYNVVHYLSLSIYIYIYTHNVYIYILSPFPASRPEAPEKTAGMLIPREKICQHGFCQHGFHSPSEGIDLPTWFLPTWLPLSCPAPDGSLYLSRYAHFPPGRAWSYHAADIGVSRNDKKHGFHSPDIKLVWFKHITNGTSKSNKSIPFSSDAAPRIQSDSNLRMDSKWARRGL